MKNTDSTKCPKGLSRAAQQWWSRLHAQYELDDDAAAFLLESALRAFDRANEAARLVEEHGIVVKDKFAQLKPNPAAAIERDARAAMLAAFKALSLDIEPLRERPGRPPGKRY